VIDVECVEVELLIGVVAAGCVVDFVTVCVFAGSVTV